MNAVTEILNGAKFIATNSDYQLITNDGVTPGNGAIAKAIEVATNKEAIYMGKPQQALFDYGLKKLNLSKGEVAMIGDNYFTDIIGAHNYGIDTIFVSTGVTKLEELENFPIKPTVILKDLSFFDLF